MWPIFNKTLSVDSVWSNKKVWAKFLTIWCPYDVIWTLWRRHESITTYSSKFADISRKFWLNGSKYCYKCKDLFHYFWGANVVFTFICCLDTAIWKWSNFDKIWRFWPENADVSKKSVDRAWHLSIFGN